MAKCHVVDVQMTPLKEGQHTYHQNIEQIPTSHDYLYISDVSIIFYCSMLLYYPYLMFYMHYYAILYQFLGLTY